MKTKAIDLSVHNRSVHDWQEVKASGVTCVVIKASQGKLIANAASGMFADRKFEEFIRGAAEADMHIGAYHYLTAGTVQEAIEEAAFFCRTIAPYRDVIDVFAAVDVEEDRYLPADRDQLTEIVNVFCEKVSAEGFRAALYTNRNYLRNRLGDVSRWPLWYALWRDRDDPPTDREYIMWQYGTEEVPGIEGLVDANYYYEYEEELPVDERDNVPAEWAEEAVAWATENGIMYGDENGDLKLHDPVTREQCIVFLHRLYEKIKQEG